MTATTNATFSYSRSRMYPKQESAIFDPRRISVIEATTKSGKSSSALVWICEQAFKQPIPGRNVWWCGPVFSQSRIMFERLKRKLPRDMVVVNNSSATIRILPSDCTIWFKSAENPDSLFGEDVWAAVLDEASRMREESWFAVRSTLTATRGPVRIIGNVRGRGWVWRLARRAEKGDDPNLGYHKITAWDAVAAGVLDNQEIEDARNILPESVFRELYLAEASENEGNPFGYEAIEACCVDALSPHRPVVFGVDLAKSMDYTVIIGLDQYGAVCHFQRFQKPWGETMDVIRDTVKNTPAFIDSTGVGDPIVEQVQRPVSGGIVLPNRRMMTVDLVNDDDVLDVQNSGVDEALQREFSDTTNIEGYKFTALSKQRLMEGLAVAIQQQQIHFPGELNGASHPIKLELLNFEYVYTRTGVRYSGPEGEHDDCVCALALARECMVMRATSLPGNMNLDKIVLDLSQTSQWDLGGEQRRENALKDEEHTNDPFSGWDFGR